MIQSEHTRKIYTGISTDPYKRLKTHNTGKGAKATRAGRPWGLIYIEKHKTKGDALRREINIKKMSRTKKLELAATTELLTKYKTGLTADLLRYL